MNVTELDRALRQLRLSGMADVLEARLRHAQTERLSPLDLVATLVSDELQRRQDRLFDRRHKQARFRDPDRSLDRFDSDFNKKMNRALLHELATARFVGQREDVLLLGPPAPARATWPKLIMRRYERASTLLTSNRPVDDWGKLLGDTAAVTALLDRLLHHAHVLKCGPRSWRTKVHTDLRAEELTK